MAEPLPRGETRLEWLQRRVLEQAECSFPKDHDFDNIRDLIIILDEGQLTYKDNDFWEMLKNEKFAYGTHYLTLCTWGSPGKIPVVTCYSSSLCIPPTQRIGFCHGRESVSLFFTLEEHQDAVAGWTSNSCYRLDPSTIQYLYFLTSRHPGATRGIYRLLLDV